MYQELSMQVEFRECDPGNLWIWFEFAEPPVEAELEYLNEVLESWYVLGKLGGFNAERLVAQEAEVDLSYLEYPNESEPLPSLMHNMGSLEEKDNWARCWFDLGTADAMALDVLINALRTLSLEYIGLSRVIIGGQNEDWPTADPEEMDDMDDYDLNGYVRDHREEEGGLE
ncbi:hypothetical protein ACVW0B_000264 [Thermostichus sp. MS-CIW-23]|jgi:hypothetical protein